MLDEALFIFGAAVVLAAFASLAYVQYTLAAKRAGEYYAWECALLINQTVKTLSVNESAVIVLPEPVFIEHRMLCYGNTCLSVNASGSASGVCIIVKNGEVHDC